MNNSKHLRRILWLVNMLFSKGRSTLAEIESAWQESVYNDEKEASYFRRQIYRDRLTIYNSFGVDIVCDRQPGAGLYYIANKEDIDMEKAQSWVLNSFAVSSLLHENQKLSSRILFENIPSGHRFLTIILTAMLHRTVLEMTYKGFDRKCEHTFKVAPYCLKVFKQRWYMVGQSDIHEELRIYSLDRVCALEETSEPFDLPKDFNAKEYFKDYYGTTRNVGVPIEDVIIRADAMTANYIRTVPPHSSQYEDRGEASSIFSYHIAPTYDFIQELRTHGPNLEVLQPQWLRERMRSDALATAKLYETL